MTNQSPQQLAEQLARKCSSLIPELYVDEWDTNDTNNAVIRILQSIPLVELLECVESLKSIPHQACCNLNKSRPFSEKAREEFDKLECNCNKSTLFNLDTKLTQILGEQKE